MIKEAFSFPSAAGGCEIAAVRFLPEDGRVRGTIQLLHGMMEHIGRYDDFARFLAGNGYVVAGHDQIGHGMSSPRERWGCLPAANGKAIMVEDVNRLLKQYEQTHKLMKQFNRDGGKSLSRRFGFR